MSALHDSLMMGPRLRVYWAGMESTSWQMQRSGWEFATELDTFRDRYRVLVRHRETGLSGTGEVDADKVNSSSLKYSLTAFRGHDHGDPVLVLSRMVSDRNFVIHETMNIPSFMRADMTPELVSMPMSQMGKTLHETGLFRPWAENSEEIIVAPEDVASLMDRIRQMQAPELAAVRQRNRAREERATTERVVAQFVAMAA